MAQEKRDRVEVIHGDGIERQQRLSEIGPSNRRVFVSRFSQFLWLIVLLTNILLGLRFVFVMIQANSQWFVNFIYRVTNPLVLPFSNIVNNPNFDVSSIVAMFVYTVVGWLIITVFELLFSDTNRIRQTSQTDVLR